MRPYPFRFCVAVPARQRANSVHFPFFFLRRLRISGGGDDPMKGFFAGSCGRLGNNRKFAHMQIEFGKYEGAGNDFVIIDNRERVFEPRPALVAALCDRRFGIGADGLMLLEEECGADFRMRYFNSDGPEATMCGNGAAWRFSPGMPVWWAKGWRLLRWTAFTGPRCSPAGTMRGVSPWE